MKFMTMGFILSNFCPQLSTGNRVCHYLELCKITHTHTQASTILERQIRDTGLQLDSNFPQRKRVFRSGARAGSSACRDTALGSDPKDPSKSHCHRKQKKDFRIHQFHPAAQVNDLQTTWSRLNLHFTSKKRESTYMRGERGEQQLSETRFLPFLPTVANCVWVSRALASCHTLAYNMNRIVDQRNIFKVEAQMEIVRYHTQCKFIVHSIFFLNDITQQREGVVVVNSY